MGAGGYRRARIRRPRNVPGWKPLTGDGGAHRMQGDLLLGGLGAAGRPLQRKALPLAKSAVTANPKVRAGVLLLNAAEKNPAARRKVTRIVRRAQAGDPKAVSAVKTLRAAKVVKDRKKRKAIAKARAQKQALAIQAASSPTAPASGPRGLFKFWDRGAG